MAENADGTLTPAPESAANALRRIADGRNDDKIARLQVLLRQMLEADPEALANKVPRIAATIIALKSRRGNPR